MDGLRMCLPRQGQSVRRFWDRLLMSRRQALSVFLIAFCCCLAGCKRQHATGETVTVLIESSPTNLDPRIGVDAQSERIDSLIFDSLVRKDTHFNLQPWLAESWDK